MGGVEYTADDAGLKSFDVDGVEKNEPSFEGVTFSEEREDTRTGNWVTGVFHIITAVIGAGILSLPYSVGAMGWIGGLIVMLAFASITLYTSHLLADVTIINGVRQATYMDAVRTTMGKFHAGILAWVQYFNLFLTAIAYTITPGTSMQNIAESYCDNEDGDGCFNKYYVFCIIFGGCQLILSQLPNMESLWFISAIGTLMSFSYSIIALALSINVGNHHGDIHGIPASTVQTMWNVFNAMGAIVFAFSFSFILVEITETMKNDKRGAKFHIKRAVNIAMACILTFYLAVSIAGYMAFGNQVCGNIISCFERPKWVIRMTNIFVLIHMLPAYQVFSQPLFEFTERVVGRRISTAKPFTLFFRLGFRTFYVVLVTFIAICLPFFSDVVGLIGAIGFWPATVFYPVEMWVRVYKPNLRKRLLMECLNVICFFVTVLAIAGSIQLIVEDSADYTVFGN